MMTRSRCAAIVMTTLSTPPPPALLQSYGRRASFRAVSKCLDCSCLSANRIPVLLLYDHRRESLEQHYPSETQSFSRSFVVGRRNDFCAAAYALLACGISVQTFDNARADVRLNRPLLSARSGVKEKIDSVE
eukprot:1148243-Pleurochrysis_carterae.AAC.1